MMIIDSQVHAYEANTPKRPWHSVPNWPDHVTGDEMVAAMDKVGVDGAIFISAFCRGGATGPPRSARDRQAGRPR
jgi:predicted TIM-barrel fold metal-dependent hydrolase